MHRNLVVIGASAGGIEALLELVARLPADLRAAVLVVLHTSGRSETVLPMIFSRKGPLPAEHPADGTLIEDGHIYIARPDFHMLVEGEMIRVLQGPRENLHRPAIDPLFRSAAVAAGRRVIAVVLTGMLDDGTSGLMVVRARGGAAIVQDPETAVFAAMPKNALEQVPDARVLPVEAIGAEIARLVGEELPEEQAAPPAESLPERETRYMEGHMASVENGHPAGRPSAFACPDCGGVLWELEQSGFLRFRCRVGHAFTARHLRSEQQHAVETALWSALRALEESAALYHRLAERAAKSQHKQSAAQYLDRATDKDANAKVLREFLLHVAEGAAD